MRIRRFSEARGIFEEEISFEPQIHCFGGGGGGGEGGGMSGSGGPPQSGGSRSSSTSTTDDAYDSGNQQTGQGSRGGSGGDGGNDNQQDRQAYSDRFGGVSTRNFNVDTNQGFVDTDKGRVYGSSEDLSKGIAEGDISPTERQDTAIDMASDIMGVDRSNVALGGDLFFGEEDVLANQDLSFGAGAAAGPALADTDIFSPTNITGEVFQTPYQQSITTPQQRMEKAYIDSAVRNFRTDQPIGLADRSVIGMMTPMEAAENSYLNDISIGVDTSPVFDPTRPDLARDPSRPAVSIVAGAQPGTPAEQVLSQVSKEVELETGVPAQQVAGIVGLTGPAVSTSRTPQEMALTGSQTFDVQPAVQGTFDPRISAGVMSDSPQQFDLEQMQLANDLIARSTAAANRTPVTLDRAMQKDREGYFSPGEYEIADTNQFQEQPEDEAIYGGRGIATPQAATLTDAERMSQQAADAATPMAAADFNFNRDVLGVDQSIPQMSLAQESPASRFDRQARMGEVQGPMSMAPVDATRFSGTDMMRQADDVLGQRAFDEAIFGDTSEIALPTVRAAAEIINSLEAVFGANQARKMADVANRPGGAFVRDPASGEILGAVGPEENISSMFFGANDAVYVGDPRGYQQGVEVGTSILGPDTNVRAVATQDPFTGQMEAEPGVDYSSQGPTDPGGDGGGMSQMPALAPETPAEAPPVDDQGRVLVQPYQYQQRGPISYAYTGLPSLAPTRLRPSYQASKRFSPLFPVS